ncbi:hypothetical protein MRX96_043648 [Rhipicephalus microplus]
MASSSHTSTSAAQPIWAGCGKRDRIVEVNGESVEGASYRDVVNRIKLDPGKVALLVIDRETDEAFARQNRTPNSRDDCETPKTPLKSDVSTVVSSDKLNDRSTTAEKPQENKLINSFWPPKPASQSVPLLVARPMNLVAPKSRQHEDEDDSQRDQQPKHQPAKTKLHGIASKPFPSMSNTNETVKPSNTRILHLYDVSSSRFG